MISRQFLLFVLVGGISATIDVGIMQALLYTEVELTVATASGFGAGLIANYLLHSRITFRLQYRHTLSLAVIIKYAFVVFLNFALTLCLVYLSQRTFGNALAGKLISLPVVATNGFFFSKYWVFR